MLVPELIGLAAGLLFLSGCEKAMHDMYDQAKYKPLAASKWFSDGQASRPLVPGTVPYAGGSLAGASSARSGQLPIAQQPGPVYPVGPQGENIAQLAPGEQPAPMQNPLPYTREVLGRGQERFNIYCAPCHSEAGDGDGMIARRGFPRPPSYHTERLRNAPDSHFYNVITHGYGAMYPYADRAPPSDRWAIIAYIRALQLSQHAARAELSDAERQRLQENRQ